MQCKLVISGEHIRANRKMLFVRERLDDFSIDQRNPGRTVRRKVERKEWLC